LDQPDTTKSAAATFSPAQVAGLLEAVSVNPQTSAGYAPLPRTDPQVAFGPGLPLIPAAIDPARPDTGRPEPRYNEYPVSSNLPGVTDKLVPWKVLRDAADQGGIPRRCIEIRKAEVATLDWAITISKSAVAAAQAARPDAARADVESTLQERLGPEIARCTTFWEQPDRGQGEDTIEWMSKLLEEHFVLDAVAIYPRRTYGGDLHSLEILDGATIKPLRDWRGGRPQAPNPAYQQILWGFPRGEFIADADADGTVLNGYLPDQLIYKRRNVRASSPYGYSAVEQALGDIDVWLRRHQWIRAEYTDGTLPAGWLKQNGTAGWTPQQTLEYERLLNDTYSGQTAERHRLRILPPGMDAELFDTVAEKYRPEYDLYLLKLVASHFDTTIAELGFTETGGLGSAGYHEGQSDVQHRKATLPTLRWLQQLITSISRSHLRMPKELEFKFLGLEAEDEAAADEVASKRVSTGRMTMNEDRDRVGKPRYSFPEADMPMLMTSRGVVFLEGASELAQPGEIVEPPKPATDSAQPADGPAASDDGNADSDGEADGPGQEDGADDREQLVKTELAAYGRWARRNPRPQRPFQFDTVTKADAPGLVGDQRVVFADAGGGESSPKAASPAAWPGWARDEATADLWAGRITRALAGVDCDTLAERWLAQELVKADEWALAAALAFLAAQGLSLAPLLASTIRRLWAEGFAIGARSARTVLAGGESVDFPWSIGDDEAAEDTLTTTDGEELQVLQDRSTSLISDIAGGRLKALASALAGAKAAGWTARQLGQALRGVLTDRAWAHTVALTEITRASSLAAQATYRAAGVAALAWQSEDDERVCPVCLSNEAAGPQFPGSTWPDGSPAPPAHPRCRCWLAPA
jgi:SPP1 gp7 family putative phage head morphogenesis protein